MAQSLKFLSANDGGNLSWSSSVFKEQKIYNKEFWNDLEGGGRDIVKIFKFWNFASEHNFAVYLHLYLCICISPNNLEGIVRDICDSVKMWCQRLILQTASQWGPRWRTLGEFYQGEVSVRVFVFLCTCVYVYFVYLYLYLVHFTRVKSVSRLQCKRIKKFIKTAQSCLSTGFNTVHWTA